MDTTADLLVHAADLLATVDGVRREIPGGWVAVTGGLANTTTTRTRTSPGRSRPR